MAKTRDPKFIASIISGRNPAFNALSYESKIAFSKDLGIVVPPDVMNINRKKVSENIYLEDYIAIFDELKDGEIKSFKALSLEARREFIIVFQSYYFRQVETLPIFPEHLKEYSEPGFDLYYSGSLEQAFRTIKKYFPMKKESKEKNPKEKKINTVVPLPNIPTEPPPKVTNSQLEEIVQRSVRAVIEEINFPLLITKSDFCDVVGISRTTLYKWEKTGLIPMTVPHGCNREFVLYGPAKRAVRQIIKEGRVKPRPSTDQAK